MGVTEEMLSPHDNDRPLVTLALFAYNQERYVREAIDGAFSQTYEPLEIFLSDDCSSDGTFGIIQAMAASYQGVHRVRVNRTPNNMGTLSHVLHVARQAQGKLFILAAGDDVSLPDRVQVLVNAWQETGAKALASSFHRINADSQITEKSVNFSSASNGFEKYFLRSDTKSSLNGASSAVDPVLFDLLPDNDERILYEDICVSFLLNRLGHRPKFVDKPLLLYRQHSDAIAHKHNMRPASAVDREVAQERALQWRVCLLRYLMMVDDQLVLRYGEAALQPLNRRRIAAELAMAHERMNWSSKSFAQRLATLPKSAWSLKLLKWKIRRMFGDSPTYEIPLIGRLRRREVGR